VQDITNVKSLGVQLKRSVGTRISAEVQAAYTHADPAPGIRSFSGATYQGSIRYEISPRLNFSTGLGRTLSGRGNLGASYSIMDNAEVRMSAKLSARTSVSAGAEIAKIQFRGEDILFAANPRGADRRYTASANLSYDLARPVVVTLGTRYRRRNSTNDVYDYSSLATSLTAAFRF
jgi:hypothetical protein